MQSNKVAPERARFDGRDLDSVTRSAWLDAAPATPSDDGWEYGDLQFVRGVVRRVHAFARFEVERRLPPGSMAAVGPKGWAPIPDVESYFSDVDDSTTSGLEFRVRP